MKSTLNGNKFLFYEFALNSVAKGEFYFVVSLCEIIVSSQEMDHPVLPKTKRGSLKAAGNELWVWNRNWTSIFIRPVWGVQRRIYKIQLLIWGRHYQPPCGKCWKLRKTFGSLISSFRRVLYVVCFLLGNYPASGFYMPTFRNTLSVPSS